MGLFNFMKAAPDRQARDTPQPPEILYLRSGIGVAIIQWSDHMAAEAAMRHPIVYRAINKLAESVKQAHWRAEIDTQATPSDRRNKETVIKDLNNLLHNPNGDMTPAMLRYWMSLNWSCYGRIPLKVGFSMIDKNRPNGLYPLEARFTNVRLNSRGVPSSYVYGNEIDAGSERYPSRQEWKPGSAKGFVDQIWKPALRGYQHKDERNSPLQAVGLPAQVIRSLLMRAIQTAEGHPNVRYMVTCDKSLTESQKSAIKQHLNEDHGPQGENAGKVPILQNAGNVDIHTLDNDLSDIHSKMPSDDMARLIFGAFGIPIALAGMGAADGAKFAGNYVESRASFWEDTVIPGYIQPICQGMTQMLCPPGVRIVPVLDSIPALIAGRILSMKEASSVNFLTTTEKREMYGLEPNSALPEQISNNGNQPTGATNGTN